MNAGTGKVLLFAAAGILGALALAPALAGPVTFQPLAPVTDKSALGSAPGNFSVTAVGEARWSWTLRVPLGRHGIEPNLSLQYGSRAKASDTLGLGFWIGGFSNISRCWPTLSQDGAYSSGTTAGVPPAFCLDGKRLVSRNGSAAEFQLEFDPGVLVRSIGTASDPTSFEVRYRDGRIVRFGSRDSGTAASNARLMGTIPIVSASMQTSSTGLPLFTTDDFAGPFTDQLRIAGWYVDRIEDRYGNFMDIDYQRSVDASGAVEIAPLEIRWTGYKNTNNVVVANPTRRMRFNYIATARLDARTGFVAGLPVRRSLLLDRIVVYAQHALVSDPVKVESVLWEYRFAYLPADSRKLDRLNSVTECVYWTQTNSQCRDPVTFGWSGTTSPLVPQFTTTSLSDFADINASGRLGTASFGADAFDMAVGDVNGDGFDDVLYRTPARKNPGGFVDLNQGNGTPLARGDWFLRMGSTTGLGSRMAIAGLPPSPGGDWKFSPRMVDLGGDGTAEVILYTEPLPNSGSTSPNQYQGFRFTCAASCDFSALPNFNEIISVPFVRGWPSRSFSLQVGDLDGDGLPDLVRENAGGLAVAGDLTSVGFRKGTGNGNFQVAVPLRAQFPAIAQPTNLVTALFDERYIVDLDGNGQAELVTPTYNAVPSISGRGHPFTFSALVVDPSTAAATVRTTTLHAALVEDSVVVHRLAGGAACGTSPTTPATRLNRYFLDLNGDGLPDSFSYASEPRDRCANTTTLTTRAFISTNTGGAFLAPSVFATQRVNSVNPSMIPVSTAAGTIMRSIDPGVRVVDLDKDGRSDLLLIGQSRGIVVPIGVQDTTSRANVIWLRSNGTSFDSFDLGIAAAPPIYQDALGTEGGFGPRIAQTGDFNGDGFLDLIVPGAESFSVALQRAREPDAISKIDGGPLASSINVQYGFAGPDAPTLYAHNGSCSWPQVCLKSLGWVVQSYTTEVLFDGQQPTRDKYSFWYNTARSDRLGRGLLGVDWIIETRKTDASQSILYSEDNKIFDLSLQSRICPFQDLRCFYGQAGMPVLHVLQKSINPTTESSKAWTSKRTWAAHPAIQGQVLASQVTAIHECEGRHGIVVLGANVNSCGVNVLDATLLRAGRTTSTFDGFGNVNVQLSETSDQPLMIGEAPAPNQIISSTEYSVQTPNNANEQSWLITRYPGYRIRLTDPTVPAPQTTITRTAQIEYEPNSVETHKLTMEPNPAVAESATTSGFELETTYERDARGNINAIKETGSGRTRTTSYGFHADDSDQIFPWSVKNSLNQSTYFYSYSAFGFPAVVEDPNGLRSTATYDALGRQITLAFSGQAETRTSFQNLMSGSLIPKPLRRYLTCSENLASGRYCKVIDPLGRVLTQVDEGFDGGSSTTFEYDLLGNVVSISPLNIGITRDGLGRVTRRERSGETSNAARISSRVEYAGRKVTQFNEANVKSEYEFDVRGRITRSSVEDPATHRTLDTRYEYWHGDQLSRVRLPVLPAGDQMTPAATATDMQFTYDLLGRRETSVDPDAGSARFIYNAFGEVKRFEDSSLGVTTFNFDDLGRVTVVTTAATAAYPSPVANAYAQNTQYVYDLAPNGIGQMEHATSNDGIITKFSYDTDGRLASTKWTAGADSYQFDYGYNALGQVQLLTFPGFDNRTFKLQYTYAGNGEIRQIDDASGATAKLLWRQVSRTPLGQNEVEQFGAAATVERVYDAAGSLRYQQGTLAPTGTLSQRFSYKWGADGLLRSRNDLSLALGEKYTHDFLERLTTWTVAQNCSPITWTYQYDDWSNLRTLTSQVGTVTDATTFDYTLPGVTDKPHAVKRVTRGTNTKSYAYGDTGAETSGNGLTFTWTPFGLPWRVTAPATTTTETVAYDGFNQRILRRVNRGTQSTLITSVGGAFTRIAMAAAEQAVFDVSGNDGVVAQIVRTAGSQVDSVHFIQPDHLGNPDAVTTESTQAGAVTGQLLERGKFEPFGERRFPWALGQAVSQPYAAPALLGFGGYTPKQDFELLDANGRWYDPTLRRFISVDPLAAGSGAGALNPYSYVRHAPMQRVDPSGFADDDAADPTDEWWDYPSGEATSDANFDDGLVIVGDPPYSPPPLVAADMSDETDVTTEEPSDPNRPRDMGEFLDRPWDQRMHRLKMDADPPTNNFTVQGGMTYEELLDLEVLNTYEQGKAAMQAVGVGAMGVRAPMAVPAPVAPGSLQKLTSFFRGLLRSGGADDIVVDGVGFGGVRVVQSGAEVVVTRGSIVNIGRVANQGKELARVFEKAAVQAARESGASVARVNVETVQNQKWLGYLVEMGYRRTLVPNQSGGATAVYSKVLFVGQ